MCKRLDKPLNISTITWMHARQHIPIWLVVWFRLTVLSIFIIECSYTDNPIILPLTDLDC